MIHMTDNRTREGKGGGWRLQNRTHGRKEREVWETESRVAPLSDQPGTDQPCAEKSLGRTEWSWVAEEANSVTLGSCVMITYSWWLPTIRSHRKENHAIGPCDQSTPGQHSQSIPTPSMKSMTGLTGRSQQSPGKSTKSRPEAAGGH